MSEPAAQTSGRVRVVALLGTSQTLSWASSYYLPALLAAPMARDLGVSVPTVFAAFSVALIVSAIIGPRAGYTIDRFGGRPVLLGTNLLFALGLAGLAWAQEPIGLFLAWAAMGLAMGSGLYEAAFATLVRLYGQQSRSAITGITLIAGFASTVGWPLTGLFEAQFGWRGACLAWAGLHLVIGLPLNAFLPAALVRPSSVTAADEPGAGGAGQEVKTAVQTPVLSAAQARRIGVLLATAFALMAFIATAMAAHLPRLLQAAGTTAATAIAVGALIGPAQVAARVMEFGLLRHLHPLLSARLSALGHPVGVVALLVVGAPAAAVFAVLHGAGNGILTIAKGTLPLVLFGPLGYGSRQGLLAMPGRVAQATSPFLFGVALDHWGAGALWLSAGLGMGAFVALMLLPRPQPADGG